MAIGQLLHPTIKCEWAGEKLHAQDVGGQMENMLQEVNISLSNKQEEAPTLEFGITANPYGFKLYEKLSKQMDQPIKLELGYRNAKSNLKMEFMFSGIQLTTGMNPMLKCTAVSKAKGPLTDNKVSTTSEEYMPLKDYPDFVSELADVKDLKFEFKGKAKEIAENYKIRPNLIQTTPIKAINDAFRPHGINVNLSDTAIDGTVVLSREPNAKGEPEADPAQEGGQGEVASAERKEYVIGLGLVIDITRKQEFQVGSEPTNQGTSPTDPMSVQSVNDEVVSPQMPPQQTATAEAYNKTGTSGTATPSRTIKNLDKPPDSESQESAAANTSQEATKVDFECLMVPYMCGIKPRDIIGIASMQGPGQYIEDFVVMSVTYNQDANGVVMLSISGERSYTGEASMTDVSKMAAKAAQCKTMNDWTALYWNQQPIKDPNYNNKAVNAARDAIGPIGGQKVNTAKQVVSWCLER